MYRIITIFLCLLPAILIGQNPAECVTSEKQNHYLAQDPAGPKLRDEIEANALKFFQQKQTMPGAPDSDPEFIIPVVVHIVHQNGAENLSDAQVLQGIQDLNDGFAQSGSYAQGPGADAKIQFCLAQRDPDGNPTNGINRVESPLTNIFYTADDSLKDLIRWDPFDYLNIWVVRSINNGFVLGFSNFPYFHGSDVDGIVVDYQVMINDWGTLAHEAGHYLALYHTFNNGCDNWDCLMSGDLVCDTPPDNSTAGGCATPLNSCSSDTLSGFTSDQNDLSWNFMDYSNFSCRGGFTAGQGERMRYFLQAERPSLLSSKGCLPPCFSPITASFSASTLVVDINSAVNFTNTSLGATSYQWLIDGLPFSTVASPSRVFNTLGKFEVTLVASNSEISCTQEYSLTIEVICSVQALFTASDLTPVAGSTVQFTNYSDLGVFAWYINGVKVSSNNWDYAYTVPAVGTYVVSFVVENLAETCHDTFTRVLEAICLDATFNVGDFYLEPGDVASFINTSQGALAYVWTVDGQPAGTDLDMSFVVEEGVHTVCLEAQTLFCSDQSCQTVYAFDASSDACEGTYYKRLGFSIYNTIAAPDSSFYLVGTVSSAALVAKMSRKGEVLWFRHFDVSPNDDRITEIFIDSDDNLLVSGDMPKPNTGFPTGYFILKYDYHNDTVLWSYTFPHNTPASVEVLLEKQPGGNYQIFGHRESTNGDPNFTGEQFFLELDRNTGTVVTSTQVTNPIARFNDGLVLDDATYVFGTNNMTLPRFRPSLSKFDPAGNRLWTRMYFNQGNQSSNGEFNRMLVENDTLLLLGSINHTSTSSWDRVLVLSKTDLDGNLLWTKEYDLLETHNPTVTAFLSLPDGYMLSGSVLIGNANPYGTAGFLVRLDKQGNVLWSKLASGRAIQTGPDTPYDGFIYVTGSSSFGKATLDGQMAGPACNFTGELDVLAFDLPSQYQYSALLPLTHSNFGVVTAAANVPALAVSLLDRYASNCVCSDPVDPCLYAADAVLAAVTASCQGDSMQVTLTVHNNSVGTLAQGTPIAFYHGDPTSTAATLLTIKHLPDSIIYAGSGTFSFLIPPLVNAPVFVVVNDNASTPAPWSVDSFPNASAAECHFQGNIRSFEISYAVPVLELGPDTAICDNSTVTFTATPGFDDYTWQDGSKEPSFTAWQPGTYWVKAKDACGGVQIDTVDVSFNPTTIANIGADTAHLCMGGQLTFNVPGFDHYQWSPSTGLNCDTCATVVAAPGTNIQYQLFASTDAGCYSADSVWVEIVPAVVTTSETIQACEGDTVSILGNVATSNGIYVFNLVSQYGCDSIHTVTVQFQSPTLIQENRLICAGDSALIFGAWATQPGVYAQSYTGANGCDSTHAITLNVNSAIALELEATDSQNGLPNGTITAEASGGTPAYQYDWSIPGVGNVPFVEGLLPGDYSLTITDAAGCTLVAQATVELSTGAYTAGEVRRFGVSPNPASAQLNVFLSLEKPAELSLEILDMTGRILRKTEGSTASEKSWTLDVRELPAGVYVCRVWTGGIAVAQRFVKQ